MANSIPKAVLKPGREKSVLRRHPWIFSGSVERIEGLPALGETIEVCSFTGERLALGAFSPKSQIRVRIWTWDIEEIINPDFFKRYLTRAIEFRKTLGVLDLCDAARMVNAESDGLPGLIVDRYSDTLVVQLLSCGVERWRDTIMDLLVELSGVKNVYERSDVDVRDLEGLPHRSGFLRGNQVNGRVQIQENNLIFVVDIQGGHKTGFYLDQRHNRATIKKYCKERSVLDCFCYTGGFSLAALSGGSKSVVAVDSSGEALILARENIKLNGFQQKNVEWLEGDVFQVLRRFRDQDRKFDLVILDPPKFAPTSAQVSRAARGYKDINLLGLKLLNPGGIFATFSCSGGVSMELFQKIVSDAALDAGVGARIIERMYQASDHPISLNFPEGTYLKGLIVQVG